MGALNKNAHLPLILGTVLCLLQVWLPGHYLTGDGPCHLYNAQIMHDMWRGSNTGLYDRFYTLVYSPNPNWLSTFILAVLLFVAKGAVAEKIFLSLYVILYVLGFYLLIRKISGAASWWLLVIFIFVFPLTLAKGFYNFSCSIAFYFWMVWSWLRFMEHRSVAKGALFFVLIFFIFFTHLLPFVFGAFTCGALVASYAIAQSWDSISSRGGRIAFFLQYSGWLLLLLSPFLVLMSWFTQKEGGLQLRLAPHPYRLIELAQFKYIITLTGQEKLPAMIAGGILCVLCVIVLVSALKNFKVHRYDGFAASLLFVALVYVFFPEDFMGRAIVISIRTQIFVFILAVCCIAYRLPDGVVKHVGALLLFLLFGWLSIVRISCMAKVSEGLDDYLSGSNLIRPGSVVLPLNFSLEGKATNGEMLADRNSVFHHAAGYLGLDKPLILLNNYEANIDYFPVRWKDDINPYHFLGKSQGIEGVPPGAGLNEYKATTGIAVDYIIMWCYEPSFLQNQQFAGLYEEINSGYHLIYTSPSNRTLLYERNKVN